jgi:hypothetical protein
MAIKTVRRYFLRKSQELDRRWLPSLAGAYRAKQDGVPGIPLPAEFPLAMQLAAVRYTTKEDLDGATLEELMTFVGLNRRDAQAVLDATAALT